MKRTTALMTVSGLLLTLLTACGHAKAGTALPKGDDAAAYVTAKFEGAMNTLDSKLGSQLDVSTADDHYFRIDDKWVHSVVTSSRLGAPEARTFQQHSLKNPDESLNGLTPADGSVTYLHMGKLYSSLAPTPWVSMPKAPGGYGPTCAFEGLIQACDLLGAVAISAKANPSAVTSARSLPDGSTELAVDVSLDAYLQAHVEILPDQLLSKVTAPMKQQVISTKVTLDAGGNLNKVTMNATLDKDGHHVELSEDFHFSGKATVQDFPQIPDASQVTALTDQAAVDDFYRRLGQIRDHVS